MDKAGNQSLTWRTQGLVADNTPPLVSVSARAPGAANAGSGWVADGAETVETYWLNSDATVTIAASDLTDGLNTLKEVGYTLQRLYRPESNVSFVYHIEGDTIDPADPPAGMEDLTLTLAEDGRLYAHRNRRGPLRKPCRADDDSKGR
jgi:hypothetical protein